MGISSKIVVLSLRHHMGSIDTSLIVMYLNTKVNLFTIMKNITVKKGVYV